LCVRCGLRVFLELFGCCWVWGGGGVALRSSPTTIDSVFHLSVPEETYNA